MRHIATLVLPIYQPANHFGATPVQHPNRTVVAFEKAAMERCTFVMRHKADALSPDSGPGGGQIYTGVMIYTLVYDHPTALGEIAAAALSIYKVENVLVMRDLDASAERWNSEDAANVAEGLD